MRMKRGASVLLCLVFALSAFGAGGAVSARAAGEVSELEAEAPEEALEALAEVPADDASGDALEQYGAIIAQAASYTYAEYTVPTGNYQYALVQMEPEDPVPMLLLSQETEDYMWYVRLFRYDPATGAVIQPPETLEEGSALEGGQRAGLTMHGDGHGIRFASLMGMTGEMDVYRVTLGSDGHLVTETVWSGRIDSTPEADFTPIEWFDVSDPSGMTGPAAASGTETQPQGENAVPGIGESVPTPVDMSDDEFRLQFGVSKAELAFLLGAAPVFPEGSTVSDRELGDMLMKLLSYHNSQYSSDGLITATSEMYAMPQVFDRSEINRIFFPMRTEAFRPGGQYNELLTVSEDSVSYNAVTVPGSSAEVTSISRDGDSRFYIDFTGSLVPTEPFMPNTEVQRRAVMAVQEDGWHIIAILDNADGAGDLTGPAQ